MGLFPSLFKRNPTPETTNIKNPNKTIGATGTTIFGGYVTSDEKNPDLVGAKQFKTYSNIMANTSIVSAGVRYFLNLVAKSNWKVVPADDTPEAIKYAEIIEDQLDSMESSWPRIVRRAAMYRFYGFSVQEWTAVKKEGMLLFKDIAPRPQVTIERWKVGDDGAVLAVHQLSPQTNEEIELPREKIVYIVDDALSDSPTGLGLFRHLVDAVNRLKRYEQLEGFGFESDLRGIPIGRAPLAALAEAVENGEITERIHGRRPESFLDEKFRHLLK